MKVRTLPPLRGPPSLIRDGKKVPSVHPLILWTASNVANQLFPANYKPGTTNYPSPFPA